MEGKKTEDVTKVTLNIRKDLFKFAKHRAIDEETTFTELVNLAVKVYLQKEKKVKGKKI